MVKMLHVFFDGQVFRPEQPLDLPPNQRYLVTVALSEEEPLAEQSYPLSAIRGLATDMGVTDLADRHHDYAHGRPKGDE